MLLLFIFLSLFIYFQRDRERERERESRGGARERIPSRLHAISAEPDAGLNLTNHEIMT